MFYGDSDKDYDSRDDKTQQTETGEKRNRRSVSGDQKWRMKYQPREKKKYESKNQDGVGEFYFVYVSFE